MKHVCILIPEGEVVLSSIVGPFKAFRAANDFMEKTGRAPLFDIHVVGLSKETQLYDGLFSVRPQELISDIASTDLVIIPASQPQALPQNVAFIPWILEQHAQGAEIASLCVGAFLLATTGLLNGRRCATHWIAAEGFRRMFPDVNLVQERIITDECGIYSSGGAYSFLNLILHLVEKYGGRDVALFLAKLLEVDINRDSQSPFTIFTGQKDHDDEPIRKAQEYIEKNIGERITVDQLAHLFLLSRRNFERRFKKATANTPVEYVQRVKIEAAKKSLESGRDHINEVMYAVGYTDSKAFRMVFKKITGLSPVDYRRRYNRELVVSAR